MKPSLPVRLWLYLPWIAIALGFPMLMYWWNEPAPVTINYVAPAFLSQPVESREEAAKYYVTEAVGNGTLTLWRYVEYCVRTPFDGVSKRAWVSRAIVWHAPDLSTYLSRVVGCHSASLATEIPSSNPPRRFDYTHRILIEVNPIKNIEIAFAPLPLLILPPQEKSQ
jgi:hypothetical protein